MVQKTTLDPILVICGPTAAGKTAAAIEVARAIDAEIVSADSGQIYRGLDIGTAKPTLEERGRVRFHLIDILNPDEAFSAADFRARALEAIADIQARGKRVIVAGGTGLYLRALEQGLFEGPGADPGIREELERRIESEGVESLHRELESIDPEASKAIPSKNRHRLIRALEVFRVTGRPISEHWREHRSAGDSMGATFLKFGLDPPREELSRRIDERVNEMIHRGLVAEVRKLVEKWGSTASGLKLIGYKEILAHLEGRSSLEDAVRLLQQHTRQYAKRQRTWFRKDKEIQWVSGMTKIILGLDKVDLTVKVRANFSPTKE